MISVWDITKSVLVVALILVIWIKGPALLSSFQPKTILETPPEVLMQLEKNAWMIQNLQANDREAKALINRLEAEKGLQAKLLEYVSEENKKKDARLEEIGVVIAELQRSVEKLRTEATVAKTPNKTGDEEEDKRRDLLTYEMKKIYAKDSSGQEFPVAWAMYFPNQPLESKWKTGTYPLEFHMTAIESENEDGTFSRSAEFHIENNFNKETKGKEFPVELKSLEWEKFERKERKFSWWNPRLGLGATFTGEDIAPKLDISMSSYGKTKRDMEWRFFTFGVGAADSNDKNNDGWKLIGSFEPFSWNIGTIVPLIENLFVAPVFTYDSDNDASFGVGASIPF